MLVQFMLKNVLSFKDETVLDMAAINAYKEHESNLIDIGTKEKFLKVAAIYGANASGKSNLYLAMWYFQQIIIESLNNVGGDKEIAIEEYYCPFSFEMEKNNSEFQIVMIMENYEYKYGFEYNGEYIASEWMYRKSIETNRTSMIFERTSQSVEFGASVRKECDIYKEQIPQETLVLTFFNKLKLNETVFRQVYNGIMNILSISPDVCENTGVLEKFLPKVMKDDKERFIKFLSAIDTGIKDIIIVDDERQVDFFSSHVGKDGKEYLLPLESESEGTIKSIILYIYANVTTQYQGVMFVDELNIKLHPLLLKFIVDLFYGKNTKAQLIYTTHDTTLMDKKFFRRDQIWFVQKDEFGYSELTALSDFKVRSDASFEKDYLAGVYGGIPFLKEFEMKEGE